MSKFIDGIIESGCGTREEVSEGLQLVHFEYEDFEQLIETLIKTSTQSGFQSAINLLGDK
jgi:hypothetical protein